MLIVVGVTAVAVGTNGFDFSGVRTTLQLADRYLSKQNYEQAKGDYSECRKSLRNCSNRKWRTSFQHILPLTALKILDGRQPACGFLPCHQQNMLENPHTIPIGTVS